MSTYCHQTILYDLRALYVLPHRPYVSVPNGPGDKGIWPLEAVTY